MHAPHDRGTVRHEGTLTDKLGKTSGDSGNLTESLQEAFEGLPIGVFVTGDDGVILIANRELGRILGYAKAELIGQSVDTLVPDALRTRRAELRQGDKQHPVAGTIGGSRALLGLRKDGTEVPLEVTLSPVRLAGTVLMLASVIDVTQRRRQEQAAQTAFNERLDFELLVSELGAEFVNLPPEGVDRRIEDSLGRIARTLGLDRSALFVVEEGGDFVHTHQWTRPGCVPPPARVSAAEQFPWHLTQVRAGEIVRFAAVDEVPDAVDRESLRRIGTQSGVSVPLTIGGHVWGAVSFGSIRGTRAWEPEIITRLQVIALIFANAIARKQTDDALQRALADNARLRDRLREENIYLRQELRVLTGEAAIVGHSSDFRRVLEQIRQVAHTETPVLLVGETGTGKTLLAARIHELSARSERAMVRVDCATLSAAWVDNQLFGMKAATHWAGQSTRHIGRLELAEGSTVFLDEVADLPLETQAALMRVLQHRQIQPHDTLGPIDMNVRIIAATRHDLTHAIAQGTFRDDLYYRLNTFTIQVPPLRDRPGDVPLLVWRFVDEFAEVYGKAIDTIDKESMAALERYPWPGNARELRNVVERAMIVAEGRHLQIQMPLAEPAGTRRRETLAALEKAHIAKVVAACGGQLRGTQGAAARLGLTVRALDARIVKLGIRLPHQ